MTDGARVSGMNDVGRSAPSPYEGAGPLPGLLLTHRPRIEQGLSQVLSGDSLLRRILRYHAGLEDEAGRKTSSGAKFLRPSLVLFTAGELGEAGDQALAGALALELIHEFSLLHDDIEDGDRTRRGRPTAWVRHGVGQAINAGDLMATLAFSVVTKAGGRATAALLEATLTMVEGQGLDLAIEGKMASVEEYLRMEQMKSGALFSCALRLGAIVAEAEARVEEDLALLGGEAGLAFQIRDDILGVWGSEEETGQPQGSDLRARKSLLVALALEGATGRDRTALEKIYGGPRMSDDDVGRVTGILERLGAREAAEKLCAGRLAKARAILVGVPFRRKAKEELEELLVHLVGRLG